MKKLFLIIICLTLFTGCLKKDSFEDITINTTIYPIEFIVESLYSDYSTINSIYPNGVKVQLESCEDCSNYTLSEKNLEEYSENELFIFNSLLHEGSYVQEMLKTNKNLKIINAGDNLNKDDYYDLEEMWLDPFLLITLARNIQLGFNEYLTNYYLEQEIENNFNDLKEQLDKLGAQLTNVTKKATNKTIVVGNDLFKFLEKENYGLTVLSLEETDDLLAKTISDVETLIENGEVKYIYIKQYDEVNETIQGLIEGTDIEIVEINTLTNLTQTEISTNQNYFTIMNENIELFKLSLYN